jgi:hypothetical protein
MTVIPTHPNKRDRGQVEVLSGMGASEEFIAAHLNLSVEDLHTHYRTQLIHGQEEANLQVAKTFFDMATSGEHPQMTLAWIKMRAKWSEAPSSIAEEDDNSEALARDKLLKLINRGQ